eukprot:COSAG06_NODE_62284_length_265_cov_0.927711_1_plen_63_part_01
MIHARARGGALSCLPLPQVRGPPMVHLDFLSECLSQCRRWLTPQERKLALSGPEDRARATTAS